MATIVEQAKAQMAKSVESTKENFSGIRTGRANPALLNGITVDYYGAPSPTEGRRHHRRAGTAKPCPSRRLTHLRPTPSRRRCAIPIWAQAHVVTATSFA